MVAFLGSAVSFCEINTPVVMKLCAMAYVDIGWGTDHECENELKE